MRNSFKKRKIIRDQPIYQKVRERTATRKVISVGKIFQKLEQRFQEQTCILKKDIQHLEMLAACTSLNQ